MKKPEKVFYATDDLSDLSPAELQRECTLMSESAEHVRRRLDMNIPLIFPKNKRGPDTENSEAN